MSGYTEGAQTLINQGNIVGALVMASMGATQETTNRLLNLERFQRQQAQAQLELIREKITTLMNLPYIPNPGRVIAALYPLDSDIEAFIRETDI